MYYVIQTLHSYAAYLVLAILIFGVFTAISSVAGKSGNITSLRKLALFGMIVSHIQLLLGLALYAIAPSGLSALSSAAMKDPMLRLLALEHPLTNIIAIIFITVGHSKLKKLKDNQVPRTFLIFYGLGLVLLLSRIPWSLWFS